MASWSSTPAFVRRQFSSNFTASISLLSKIPLYLEHTHNVVEAKQARENEQTKQKERGKKRRKGTCAQVDSRRRKSQRPTRKRKSTSKKRKVDRQAVAKQKSKSRIEEILQKCEALRQEAYFGAKQITPFYSATVTLITGERLDVYLPFSAHSLADLCFANRKRAPLWIVIPIKDQATLRQWCAGSTNDDHQICWPKDCAKHVPQRYVLDDNPQKFAHLRHWTVWPIRWLDFFSKPRFVRVVPGKTETTGLWRHNALVSQLLCTQGNPTDHLE